MIKKTPYDYKLLTYIAFHPRSSAIEIQKGLKLWFVGHMFIALYKLEMTGELTSAWLPGPYPRRRVYWMA